VARWHPSRRVGQVVDDLQMGNVADPDFELRWLARAKSPPQAAFPLAERTTKTEACSECLQRDDCLVCPVAGPDPQKAPDAHCLFARMILHQRRAMPQNSPMDWLLAATGASAKESAWLSRLVWQARQEV
jgi:hypothetical protein